MKNLKIILSSLFLVFVLIGCSGNSENSASDAITKDTGLLPDSGIQDTGIRDISDITDSSEDIISDTDDEDISNESDVNEIRDISEDLSELPDIYADTSEEIRDTGTGDIFSSDDAITDITCKETTQFDYSCDPKKPETCPGGMCLLNQCVAPTLDPDRWSECSDGHCSVCEDEKKCPADCRKPYEFKNSKRYDGENTITVWVHGFYNKKPEDIKNMVYGKDRGCSDLEEKLQQFGVNRPCSDTQAGKLSPVQLTSVEYYGAVPADYLSQKDIEEIEKYPYDKETALHRYALIVAKFIKYKLSQTGATNVNLACHSMGCLISRYMIENDIENLATDNRVVRWFTSAGVIAGARLARLYDNPKVQDTAKLIGLELSDFVVMHPDFVMDYAAVWDHRLYEGNSPLLSGIYINHYAATDPKIKEAFNIALLDLNNPGDEPNDGIMYTLDEYFHNQEDSGAFFTKDNEKITASRSYNYVDHMTLPETDGAGILATAALFHKMKVIITLDEVYLKKDRENHKPLDGEHGTPPAEISAQVEIRYNPYIKNQYKIDAPVHIATVEHRSSDLFTMNQDETKSVNLTIFDGPVFDEMDKIYLRLKLLEVDYYPRFGIKEWSFDIHQELISFENYVDLKDYTFDIENDYIKAKIRVDIKEIY